MQTYRSAPIRERTPDVRPTSVPIRRHLRQHRRRRARLRGRLRAPRRGRDRYLRLGGDPPEEDGKVRVSKTEKPTQHGAWTGAGVGALVGIIFPPAILGSAIVGAGAGGLIGHLRKGISRDDLKDLGDELEAGTAAVIVIGESKIEEQLQKAVARSNKLIEKQIDADADELEREIEAAAKEDAS